MAQEIERQFSVNTDHPDWIKMRDMLPSKRYVQATIHRGDDNKLRVRLIEDLKTGEKTAAFTFKVVQKTSKNEPNIRLEYEWDVPYRVALYIMIGHTEVEKIRRTYIHTDGKVWEIDEYQGPNEGIVLADVELTDVKEKVKLPSWLGQETTKLKKITNNSFSNHPFVAWSQEDQLWYASLKYLDGKPPAA